MADIRLNITGVTVSSAASFQDINIITEDCTLSGWTYSVIGDFDLTATSQGNDTIRVSWGANDTSSPRYADANFVFTDTNGDEYPVTFTVDQVNVDTEVTLTPDTLYVSYDSVSAITNYSVNVWWAGYSISASSASGTSGFAEYVQASFSGGSIIIEYPVNNTDRQRYAYFDVKVNGPSITSAKTTCYIYQGNENSDGRVDIITYPSAVTISSAAQDVYLYCEAPEDDGCYSYSGWTNYEGGTGSYIMSPEGAFNPVPIPSPTVVFVVNGETSQLCFSIPANTGPQRMIIYKYRRVLRTYDKCENHEIESEDSVFFTITQEAADSPRSIVLSPEVIRASSADTSGYTTIVATNCTYSSYTITNRGGQQYTIGDPVVVGNEMRFTFPANTGTARSETFSMQLFDTEGNAYGTFLVVSQAESGSTRNDPEPWSKTGDTAYTWYSDSSLLNILPPEKILAYDEETGYWPVTAHTFPSFEVRASGDVSFQYEVIPESNPNYNSHSLYVYTEDNSGDTQQISGIKLVAYSGTSAYSASTTLIKDPDVEGWITATPNPLNVSFQENTTNVYLLLANCQRSVSDELTANTEFDSTSWVTVNRIDNTTLAFNFQKNDTGAERSTYYNACGRDANNNQVTRRITLNQGYDARGITLTPDASSLPKSAGSFTVRVESTDSGNFSFSASPWLSITSYVQSSPNGGTLYVDYYANEDNTDRLGTIWASQQVSTSPFILTASTDILQAGSADTASITVDPGAITVGMEGGNVTANISYSGLASEPVLITGEGNMDIIGATLDNGLITIVYGDNDTNLNKSKTFTITATSVDGNVISATFTVTQTGTGLQVAPIWRDYVLDVQSPGQGYINYNIMFDGTVVYTGRAYSMGGENIEIFFNNLCKSFLSNHIDFIEGPQTTYDWLGEFTISSPEVGDISSVKFYEDYSYEDRVTGSVMTLNNPITGEVVEGGLAPICMFFPTGGTVTTKEISEDGTENTYTTIFPSSEQFRYFWYAEPGERYTGAGIEYKTIPRCEARYSLYYVNSFGGVDVLPFKGRAWKKTDNINRFNYSKSFRNYTREFENVNYMNEIKPTWELHTGFINDSQSKKMHEVVESTIVYLFDAEELTYTPVVMTDKKLEYKTFNNQGRTFYDYTITVEESQSKERR